MELNNPKLIMILLEILFCVFEDGKRIIDDLLRKDFYVSLKLRGGGGTLSQIST